MTRLSVNINKIATLRNARGGNMPDVTRAAQDCERFGAQGITVHPRPDERHIRYSDVRTIRPLITTEFNIEGNPTVDSFVDLVLEVVPDQVTLVPDSQSAITSNAGWDTLRYKSLLMPRMAEGAAACGASRVELYTADYAARYPQDREAAIAPYLETARAARDCGLGLNAGHDLSLENLAWFIRTIPWTDEVSIGHALICDALYLGLEKTIQAYLGEIRKK